MIAILAIALWGVWGASVNMAGVPKIGYDGILLTWIFNQAAGNIAGFVSGGVGNLFMGNIFYSYTNVLAYSDMHFLSALTGQIGVLMTSNFAGAFGFNMVFGQMATMMILYLFLTRFLKTSKVAALIAVTAFGLSQIRWQYQVHLQMWSMQYWLVGTWLMISGLEKKILWKTMLGAGVLGLQVWESLLPVYFAATLIIAYCVLHKTKICKRQVLFGLCLFAVVSYLPAKAYWDVSREFSYQRSIRDAANGGMGLDELFTKFWSPGLMVLLIVTALRAKYEILRTKNRDVLWLVVVMIVGLILAMGPTLKWQGKTVKIAGRYPIPMPYAVLYYTVPGMNAFRTPSRWIWVFGFGATGLIGLGLTGTKKAKLAGLMGCLVVAIAGGTRLEKWRPMPGTNSFPPVYKWLVNQPGKVVLEVPVYLWGEHEQIEEYRMVYSLMHKKRLVNGFSGFTPPDFIKNVAGINNGGYLKMRGVDYVIVHRDECKLMGLPCTIEGDENKIVWSDEKTVVVGRF